MKMDNIIFSSVTTPMKTIWIDDGHVANVTTCELCAQKITKVFDNSKIVIYPEAVRQSLHHISTPPAAVPGIGSATGAAIPDDDGNSCAPISIHGNPIGTFVVTHLLLPLLEHTNKSHVVLAVLVRRVKCNTLMG